MLRGAGRAFCAGYDFGGGFQHWGDAHDDRRASGTPARTSPWPPRRSSSPTQKFMSVWRCAQAGDRPGPRLVRRRRQRLRALRRPRDRQRGRRASGRRTRACGARTCSGMWIYRLGLARAKWHALTGRPLTGREAAGCELINEAVPFARARGHGRRAGRRARPHPHLAARRREARRQPGLREHGPGSRHPDARPDPRRADAQHARRAGVHRARRDGRRPGGGRASATARSATTARRRRPARRTRATSSSPERGLSAMATPTSTAPGAR